MSKTSFYGVGGAQAATQNLLTELVAQAEAAAAAAEEAQASAESALAATQSLYTSINNIEIVDGGTF